MNGRPRPVLVQQPEECIDCGALIFDWFKHQSWHQGQDEEHIAEFVDERVEACLVGVDDRLKALEGAKAASRKRSA